MENFAVPARPIVARMTEAAAADPARKPSMARRKSPNVARRQTSQDSPASTCSTFDAFKI